MTVCDELINKHPIGQPIHPSAVFHLIISFSFNFNTFVILQLALKITTVVTFFLAVLCTVYGVFLHKKHCMASRAQLQPPIAGWEGWPPPTPSLWWHH